MTKAKQRFGICLGVGMAGIGLVLGLLAKPLSWSPLVGNVRRLSEERFNFLSDLSLIVIGGGVLCLLMVFHRWLGEPS